MFKVEYIDDFKVKHLCVARNIAELKFILLRFDYVTYEKILVKDI